LETAGRETRPLRWYLWSESIPPEIAEDMATMDSETLESALSWASMLEYLFA
jgi:hypothetical protein